MTTWFMAQKDTNYVTKKRAVSAAIFALLAYGGINAGLKLLNVAPADKLDFPYHGWTYWSMRAIDQLDKHRRNIVLLGSSLVVTAVSECDATEQNKILDLCFYRNAEYLDKQLRAQFGRDYCTLDLSVPGQNPSDAYLTLKAALKRGIKPGAVIYGVAPRDFIDATLKDSTDTEPYRYLSRVSDIDDCADDLITTPEAKLDWVLQKYVYLYGMAPKIAAWTKATFTPVTESALLAATKPFRQMIMTTPLTAMIPDQQSFDLAPGTRRAHPAKRSGPYFDNVDDYKNRYRNPDLARYQQQMKFLEKLVGLCQSNDIEIVLANMPITEKNWKILKPSWQEKYMADLADLAARHDAVFLDECKFDRYEQADYRDTVHLNAFGAKKFIDGLVLSFSSHPQATRAIVSSGALMSRSLASSDKTKVTQ